MFDLLDVPSNPRVSCHELPEMDLSPWREGSNYFGAIDEYKSAKSAAGAAAKAKAAAA